MRGTRKTINIKAKQNYKSKNDKIIGSELQKCESILKKKMLRKIGETD